MAIMGVCPDSEVLEIETRTSAEDYFRDEAQHKRRAGAQ
jgi:hypothetical protein